jgi:hypothetical protein
MSNVSLELVWQTVSACVHKVHPRISTDNDSKVLAIQIQWAVEIYWVDSCIPEQGFCPVTFQQPA